MKLRCLLLGITACAVLGMAAGCSKKPASETPTNAPAVETPPAPPAAAQQQPQAQPMTQEQIKAAADAMIFSRAYERAATLVERKDYKNAQETLAILNNYQLSPDQQAKVNALKAQIPPGQ